MSKNPTLQKCTELCSQLKEDKARGERISRACADQEKELANLAAAETQLAGLQKRRGDIEAEILLGEGDPAGLEQIDNEIEKSRKEVERLSGAKATAKGLQHKLDQAESSLRGTKAALQTATREYFQHEAEAVGAEYLSAANQVTKLYRRLLALDSFLAPAGYPIAHSRTPSTCLQLPAFMLECHSPDAAGGPTHGRPQILAEAHEIAIGVCPSQQADIDAERARLSAAGGLVE